MAALGVVAGFLILACDTPGGGAVEIRACVDHHAHNQVTQTCVDTETPSP